MKLEALLFSVLFMPVKQSCNETQGTAANSSDNNTTVTASDTTNERVKFGVMVAKTEGQVVGPEKQIRVAKALGVNYIRAKVDIQGWDGVSEAYEAAKGAGLKVLLNINYGVPRNAAGEHDPVPFPTDMNAYTKSLNSILDKYKPELVVIENEEDNPNYHEGSADEYINELKTGIQVAHSKGLKVTNGGITVREICLIIVDDYMQRGEKDKAMNFAQKAFPANFAARLGNGNLMKNPQIARQVEFGRKLMETYKTLDLDYVNFHWYEPVQARGKGQDASAVSFDPETFAFVVNYLKTKTGKPVMSNEFGVLETSAELVKALLKAVKDNGLSYAIFYSADGGPGKAIALQNASGDLRDNGKAFRDFVKQN
jgi:hypothetical protein